MKKEKNVLLVDYSLSYAYFMKDRSFEMTQQKHFQKIWDELFKDTL